MKGVSAVGAALVAVSVGLAGCKKPGTYVHVEILPAAAGEPANIVLIVLDADLAGKTSTLQLSEPDHSPIKLPTDVTLEIKSGSGQLALTVIGLNAEGAEVDRATTTATVASGAIAQASLQFHGGKPDLQPVAATHDFGAVLQGVAGAAVSIGFSNIGFRPSGVLSAALGGVGASSWIITTDTCSGSVLAARANCSVGVQFDPNAMGALAATLTVIGTPGGSAVVALTGTGTPNPQTLTVTLAGSGGGSVVSGETPTPKISCSDSTGVAQSGTCTATYDWGTTVTLTATNNPDSFFKGGLLVGAPQCSANPCTFSMTNAVSATVNFDHNPVPVNVSFAGTGSGSVADTVTGFSCATPGPCMPDNVTYGSTVTLTATPASGSVFTSWTGCTTTSGPTCNISNVTAATPVTATFTKTFTVTVNGSGNGSGTVTGGSLNCTITNGVASGTCTTSVNYGSSLTLSETPVASSNFSLWAGGCVGSSSTCTINNITSTPATVTASFGLKTFTVSVAGGGNGSGAVTSNVGGINCTITSGAPSGTCTSTPVNYGSSMTLTETPATSSNFTSFTSCSSITPTTCTISNITANTSSTATFALKTFTVSIVKTGTGTVTSTDTPINCGTTCSATVNYGSTATLNAAASAGFLFVGWSAGACTGTGTCSITNITSNQSVTANFPASFCAASVSVGQAFGAQMQGCPGAVTQPNRVTLCSASAHVCDANEWVQGQGGTAPTHHYWTDDALNYSFASGVCGTAACGTGNCFVSTGSTYTINCGANTPMRVCAGTGAGFVNDPEGNSCQWTGCGFNSVSPNQYFGGCSGNTTAGTLCCSGQHQYFVSNSGLDTDPGTSAKPFKTITHGLAVAVGGDTVFVRPGGYTATSGETFPLNVPAGVNLIGDESNRGSTTTINGCGGSGPATVSLDKGSTIAGFSVTCSASGFSINAAAASSMIRNNTVNSSGLYGINIAAGVSQGVLLNTGTGNSFGALVFQSFTGGKVENNTFTSNGYGIETVSVGADFGGGSSQSVGNNILSCNTNNDLWINASGGSILANNNKWDHTSSPPLGPTSALGATNPGGGIDVFDQNNAAPITTSNPQLAPSPCPNPCSSTAVSVQLFDGFMGGCGAPGTPAAISFASRASLCSPGCHACTAVEWNTHRGSIAPNSNYWTGDASLNFGGGASNSCIVSTTSGVNNCTGGANLVCPNSASLCQIFGCGLDTATPQFFGGCSTSSTGTFANAQGTLCCCP